MEQTLQNSRALRVGFGVLSLVLFEPRHFDKLKDFERNVSRSAACHV